MTTSSPRSYISTTSSHKGCVRDLLWNGRSGWDLSGRPVEKQAEIVRHAGTKRVRDTKKQPVFGILCRNGLVCAGLWTTLKPGRCNHSSPGRSLLDLWSALIPGDGIPESLFEDLSIVWWIMGRSSTPIKRKSHQRPRRILGIPEKKTCLQRRNPTGVTTPLPRWICAAV